MGRNCFLKHNIEGLTEFTDYELKLYDEWVAGESHDCYNRKTTTVIIKLYNGFEIVGIAGCEHPENFSESIGRIYALKDALRKLGKFIAFYRAQDAYYSKIEGVACEDDISTMNFEVKSATINPEQLSAIEGIVEGLMCKYFRNITIS